MPRLKGEPEKRPLGGFEERMLRLLGSILREERKQSEMLEAMALALVGQDKAVEAVMEMMGKEEGEEHREDVLQRGLSHEARILEQLSQWQSLKGGPFDDVEELPEREDA